MSAHTQGPWYWASWGKYRVAGLNSVHHVYADVPVSEDAEADARLIAAAPELLHLVRCWAALDAGAWHVERHAHEKAGLIAKTEAAIKKATEA
jgi:hypothetical protein